MIVLFPFVFLMLDHEEDRLFLEGLYMEYRVLMYAQALKITRNTQEAEDAVSEGMLALMKKTALLRTLPCNKLKAYVVITVKHMALNRYRKMKRESTAGGIAAEEMPGSASTEEALFSRAGIEAIKAAICALPEREKEIMLMKYFRELTDAEIAEETGLREVSVRVHLSRARKHLSGMLAEGGMGE